MSIRATVKARGVQRERRFPDGTSKQTIRDWIDRERGRLKEDLPPASPGTFAKDVERYLDTLADRPTLRHARSQQLDWWIGRFGKLRRHHITAPLIRAHLAELRTSKSASTCNHYRLALAHLWSTLDGRNAANPLRDVPRFQEPEAEPRNLSPELVAAVLNALPSWGCATKHTARPTVNKGAIRLRVMATTGLSPAEIKRIQPDDLLLEQRAVYVRRRMKGKGAPGMVLPLTTDGVAALEAFAAGKAFGRFASAGLWTQWARACQRLLQQPDLDAGLRKALQRPSRPYDLRHTFGTFLLQQTGNLDTTQALMRHLKKTTTLRYARAAVAPQLRAAVDALDGRQPSSS